MTDQDSPAAGTTAAPGAGPGTMLPYGMLVGAVFFWSSTWVLSRLVWQDVTPVSLAFWRWVVALLIMLPFGFREAWARRRHIAERWGTYLVLGITGVSFFNTLVYLALRTTTAVNVSMISASTPMIIVGMSWLAYRETIRRGQTLGILFSLVGVAIIITRGDPTLPRSLEFRAGDLWVLVAMLFWAYYSVALRRRPQELSPFAFMTVVTACGVLVMIPCYLAEWYWFGTMRATPLTIGTVVYMAVFASVAAFYLWNRGILAVGANRSGPFIHLMPVFTTVMAMLVLGERVHAFHLYGVAMIFLGILLASRAGRTPRTNTTTMERLRDFRGRHRRPHTRGFLSR